MEFQFTNLLTEQEFQSTFTGKMSDVTETAETVIDIWPYVEILTNEKVVENYTFKNELVEKVYQNQTNTFIHVLLPTPDENVFIVIVVDLVNIKIYGHYNLDLNALYGLD
jgi:hypothetical protein